MTTQKERKTTVISEYLAEVAASPPPRYVLVNAGGRGRTNLLSTHLAERGRLFIYKGYTLCGKRAVSQAGGRLEPTPDQVTCRYCKSCAVG